MIDSMQRLLIFNVQGNRYALDIQEVAEVLDPPATFPVPWAPGCFKGAMNYHGSLVSVLDLAAFMNSGTAPPFGSILVLDKRIANLALWVDGVENIVPGEVILEEDESNNPLVAMVLVTAEGEVGKLAIDKLLERIEETMRK